MHMQSQGVPLCQLTPEHSTDRAAPVMPKPEPRHSELHKDTLEQEVLALRSRSHISTPAGITSHASQLAGLCWGNSGGNCPRQAAEPASAVFPFMSSLWMVLQDPRSSQARGALERAEKKHTFTAGRKRER